MVVKRLILFLLVMAGSACTIVRSDEVLKIALLAPFEGRYREVGYDALYAARLALQEHNSPLNLLAVDDGGSVLTAIDRARALTMDDAIQSVLLVGPYATVADVQQALETAPHLIVGHWNTQPVTRNSFMLANPEIDEQIDAPQNDITELAQATTALIGSEMLSLEQFARLREDLDRVTVISSAMLPDDDFRTRYQASDPFAPEPSLMASLTYDATVLIIAAHQQEQPIANLDLEGLHGRIRFADGYWVDAPFFQYRYTSDGQLVRMD